MKLLLLSNNSVVVKLVTMSAHKISAEIDFVESIEDVNEGDYDLLVIDDQIYTEEVLSDLSSKIKYTKTLFIRSKNTEAPEEFKYIITKPFLPTDMVELLIMIENALQQDEEENVESQEIDEEISDDLQESFGDDLDLEGIDELESLDDMEFENTLDDSEIEADLDEILDDNEDLTIDEESFESDGGILDEEDLKEVQDLLEDENETDEDDMLLDFDDELELTQHNTPEVSVDDLVENEELEIEDTEDKIDEDIDIEKISSDEDPEVDI